VKVHVAMVMHEYGATGFAALDKVQLDHKVARWCIDCLSNDERAMLALAHNEEIIEYYFENHAQELLFTDEDDL